MSSRSTQAASAGSDGDSDGDDAATGRGRRGSEEASRLGRPMDPGVDARTLQAAREEFLRYGWSGFAIQRIASRAGVGKAAIYRRWPDREALLESLLVSALEPMGHIDTGSFESDLREFARYHLAEHLSGRMDFLRRVSWEAAVYPELFGERVLAIWRPYTEAGRAFIRRAIQRGELPPDTSPARLMEVVLGMITLRVSSIGASTSTRERVARDPESFIDYVVGFVLHAYRVDPA